MRQESVARPSMTVRRTQVAWQGNYWLRNTSTYSTAESSSRRREGVGFRAMQTRDRATPVAAIVPREGMEHLGRPVTDPEGEGWEARAGVGGGGIMAPPGRRATAAAVGHT